MYPQLFLGSLLLNGQHYEAENIRNIKNVAGNDSCCIQKYYSCYVLFNGTFMQKTTTCKANFCADLIKMKLLNNHSDL